MEGIAMLRFLLQMSNAGAIVIIGVRTISKLKEYCRGFKGCWKLQRKG